MSKIQSIISKMSNILTNEQIQLLEIVLYEELSEKNEISVYEEDENERLLKNFASVKKLEGCTVRTIVNYVTQTRRMLEHFQKKAADITTDDLRYYLACYQKRTQINNVTLNNMIRNISAFYTYLENEDMVLKNPMRPIKPAKVPKRIKPTISSIDMDKMKFGAECIRDLAIIETLYSTGCRVSELCSLNIADIKECKAIVWGKGSKERTVYFTEESLHYLNMYLDSRTDNNEALFVGKRKPNNRITVACVEDVLRKLWRRIGIDRIHPHMFRRTVATDALRKGMRIEQVQKMLGHVKIDTTMEYCQVDQMSVEYAHRQYVG